MPTEDYFDGITQTIINHLEQGNLIWVKPWASGSFDVPHNAHTKKRFMGLNHIILTCTTLARGFSNNLYLTYKQAQAEGGQVRKGERSTTGIRPIDIKTDFEDAAESKRIVAWRAYGLFNIDQCDGLDHLRTKAEVRITPVEREPRIDAIIEQTKIDIIHHGDRCFYTPAMDLVTMVPPEHFLSIDGVPPASAYYATVFHELIHATGHYRRLDRECADTKAGYAFEELVAEIGAMLILQDVGIDGLDRHGSAYVASWLSALKNDRSYILKAATLAVSASNYILNPPSKKTDTQQPVLNGP